MDIFKFATEKKSEIFEKLNSSQDGGLTENEAQKKLLDTGPNELDRHKKTSLDILIRQLKSSFIYLLTGALLVTFFLGHYIDSLMIFVFILINVFLGFFQEYKSEKTVELLKKYIVGNVQVWRSGELKIIKSNLIVPGDLIVLETGSKIPADIRFISTGNIAVDESILTGETLPVYKKAEEVLVEPKEYYEALNLGFSGTTVVRGSGTAIVIATGAKSSLGMISKLTDKKKITGSFEKSINHFSNFILKLVGATLVLIISANVLIKGRSLNYFDLIIFCIALTVSVIPEALPLVTTYSLSNAARKLAKKKVLAKRLSAIEDLGGIEILFSDKTGTLTENHLTIKDIYDIGGKNEIIFKGCLASDFEKKNMTEPFDLAFWESLGDKDRENIRKNYKKLVNTSFDPKIRRNLSIVQSTSGFEIITRGAPEEVLKISKTSDDEKEKILFWIKEQGAKGNRTMALAIKKTRSIQNVPEDTFSIKDFKLLGIVSFIDPIKKDATSTIKKAITLGVSLKIITGDSPDVSGSVGYELGLISDPGHILTGNNWSNGTLAEKIDFIKNHSVFSRFSPEQKYEIIKLASEKNSVGFLGEGINDAPALKLASVSLVVDSASDIARESSDIILLDRSLSTIVRGIEEGRKVFANTNKYIKATLASNFGNFFSVAIASLLVDFLPMLPIQILLLNLLSDVPMIAIATDNVDISELKRPKSTDVKEVILFAVIIGVISTVFDFIFFAVFVPFGPQVLQTNWFIGSILTELTLIFSIRTKLPFYKGKKPSAPIIILSVIASLLTVFIPISSMGEKIFSFTKPTGQHLLIIFSIVLVYFIFNEIVKLIFKKALKQGKS